MPYSANKPVMLPHLHNAEKDIDWSALLHRASTPVDYASLAAPFRGKRVLITGAGGSIGSALAKLIAVFQPECLILLDSSEHGLYELQNELALQNVTAPLAMIPGDVCDSALLHETLTSYRPQIVYHAAAYKHVPLMEDHPLAALRTNALGSYTLARTCVDAGVEQCVLLSTDKAASPFNAMGVSKRIAEIVFRTLQSGSTRMKALRLCNVLGSRGSVVPRFIQQIAHGGPVTVTHPEVRRYFLPLRESLELLVAMAQPQYSEGIYIPRAGEPVRILDLAQFLLEDAGPRSATNISITYTGLRPGDKMEETLLSENEIVEESADDALPLRRITGTEVSAASVIELLHQLEKFVEARDVGSALHVVQQLVPEYQPSDSIRRYRAHPVTTL